jgi:hypothetical protein
MDPNRYAATAIRIRVRTMTSESLTGRPVVKEVNQGLGKWAPVFGL